ncbi:MAG: ABC transporter ATP-binding protein [Acidobacteriota bacterium]|jgi:ABC-2 type transport system ATP-binding protein
MTTFPNRPRLEIRDLRKLYRGGPAANDGISLSIHAGEVFGLLGPNGAGKTTLVNQIIGLLEPTSGSIRLDGIDLVADPGAARQLCSYLPQGALPIASFTLEGAITMAGRIRGAAAAEAARRVDSMVQRLELTDWRSTIGHRLSGGVLRLVGFCMATVQPGRLVILDEPTNDVDPLRRRLLWREIRRVAEEGAAVLLVTHNVLEAEKAVDRLAIVDRGRILAEGTPGSLRSRRRAHLRLRVTLEPRTGDLPLPEFASLEARTGRRLLVAVPEAEALDAVQWARGLQQSGLAEEYELGPITLEDTYATLIGRDDALQPEGDPRA